MRRAIGVITAITNRQRHLLVNGGVGFSTFAAGDALSQGARCPPLSMSAGQEVAAEPSWGQQFVERCVRCERNPVRNPTAVLQQKYVTVQQQ